METWWNGRGDPMRQVAMFDECDTLECQVAQFEESLSISRSESDSWMVWGIVLGTLAVAAIVLVGGIGTLVWGHLTWKRARRIQASLVSEDSETEVVEEAPASTPTRSRVAAIEPPVRTPGKTLNEKDTPTDTEGREKMAARHGYNNRTTPIIQWKNLSYWVPLQVRPRGSQAKEDEEPAPAEKKLLFSVDGAIPEGSLTALMGPSGSGKSTLLDLLTGRRTIGRCEGELWFEGAPVADQQDSYITKSGYMRQQNTGFLEGLSVLENLFFAAMLRRPGTLEAQMERVETVIKETALEDRRHTRAGGLSGGQQRRLTLALELLADRRIFFLDEPTSGLDTTAALELISILKVLSKKVTVVVSIHQPRREVWQLFSHTILMKTGRAVYCGPADKALDEVGRCLPDLCASTTDLQRGASAVLGMSRARSGGGMVRATSGGGVVRATSGGAMRRATSGGGIVRATSGGGMIPARLARLRSSSNIVFEPVKEDAELEVSGASLASISEHKEAHAAVNDDSGHPTVAPKAGGGGAPAFVESQQQFRVPEPAKVLASTLASRRTIPERILDMLVKIDLDDLDEIQAHEAEQPPDLGTFCWLGTLRSVRNLGSVSVTTQAELSVRSEEILIVAEPHRRSRSTERGEGDGSKVDKKPVNSVWKVAMILLFRSHKSGYTRRLLQSIATLFAIILAMALAFRASSGESLVYVVASVTFATFLPGLLVFQCEFVDRMNMEWSLGQSELADGFYSSSAIMVRVVMDHLATAVVLALVAVGIAQGILWQDTIDDVPVSGAGVYFQLASAVILVSWLCIGVFDSLSIGGLSIAAVHSTISTLTAVTAFFSGRLIKKNDLPDVLQVFVFISPYYWSGSFMLRIILDGLEQDGSCDDDPIYCAMSYASMAQFVEDLQRHHTGTYLLALLIFALLTLIILAIMIRVKGRRVGILDGLNSDSTGTTSPKLPSPGTAPLGAATGAAATDTAAESLA